MTLLFRSIFCTAFLLLTIACAWSQTKVQQVVPEKTRILFVLDGSGSMDAMWGADSRMNTAKAILSKLVDSLRANRDVELALRVYGHRYPRQANNCEDSNLEVPFGKGNHTSIINKIRDIKPKGVTPITYSIRQAVKDFPGGKGYRNILILITDGIESCGGDPCAVSLELQKKGVFLRPFIIGLGIEQSQVLDCMGKFVDSQNSQNFNQILNETIETTFAKTTVSVELLNGQGAATETNVNVSFVNNMTGVSMYDFLHYLDKQGRPDSVQIDPVLSYNIVVSTIPPVIKEDVGISNGKHNVVKVEVPQGRLLVKPEGRGNPFSVLVHEKGKGLLLHQQRSGESTRFIAGEYVVETLTFPKRIFDVTIEADKVKTISIPEAGLVNINTLSTGFGSLFEILENGESKWVCNLADNVSIHTYNLLPGQYKISFRVKKAAGSKYTAVKNFEVKSGQTLNLSLF